MAGKNGELDSSCDRLLQTGIGQSSETGQSLNSTCYSDALIYEHNGKLPRQALDVCWRISLGAVR